MKFKASATALFLIFALTISGHYSTATAGMDLITGNAGKVVETMTAGEYTYVRLEKDKQSGWTACPAMKASVGQELAFTGCTPMMNFESKALNRTFDIILFCGPPLSQGAAELLSKKSTGSDVQVPKSNEVISVESAKGQNAYTVADCYAKSNELDKKSVTVRGKVMKISTGILNSNWIHLQDGTGNVLQKNNDVVVTTRDVPKVGDTVTVKGTLAKNKDFGSGYKYAVIIEQATLSK
jgi:16S rRNA G966 N2-methylase RsmD